MGFDLMGIEPKSRQGEYFRNSVWWWRPLWRYVSSVCEDILTEAEIKSGSWNDGRRISAEKASKIGARLKELASRGEVKKYEEEYRKTLTSLRDEPCECCKGSGVRYDSCVKGICNGCNGKGKVRPWASSYPFSEENVRDFAEFALRSGGFKIY